MSRKKSPKVTKLSDFKQIIDHMNKAYSEVSKVRHLTRQYGMTQSEYDRLLDVYRIMGMIRTDHLEMSEWDGKDGGG